MNHLRTALAVSAYLRWPYVRQHTEGESKGGRPGVCQAMPYICLDCHLDPIETSAKHIQRSRTNQNLDCSQTRASSCRNLESRREQITRDKSREERGKTDDLYATGYGCPPPSPRNDELRHEGCSRYDIEKKPLSCISS